MVRVLASRYELGERLGGGVTAEVFAGYDVRLDRRVAVKLLEDHGGDSSVRKRFLREAQVAASVDHPNVVTVHDSGLDGEDAFLVMELVEGGNLGSVVADGPLDAARAVAVAGSVLAALDALHGGGVVHRDVKPANVLVTTAGSVKLTDFGVAHREGDSRLTAAGAVVGTPAYLSPEQAMGASPSAASDIYSVGVLCFEMLTGAVPFGRGSSVAVALAHVREPVPDIRRGWPEVPEAVASVVERALAKSPAERWQSAAAMRAALQDAVEETQIELVAVPFDSSTVPTAQLAVGPTMESPAGPAGSRIGSWPVAGTAGPTGVSRPPWRRVGRAVVAAVLGAVLIVGAVILGTTAFDGGDDPESTGTDTVGASTIAAAAVVPATEAPSSTTAPPTTGPTTTAAPTLDGGEMSLDDVIDALADDPEAAGPKGGDLLGQLVEIRDENSRRRSAELARDRIDDIDQWLAEGQLDPAAAVAARTVLEPIADHPAARSGDD